VSTVAASLGEDALKYGLIAGVIALVIIMALLIFLYGYAGIASSLAMLIYTFLMIFFLSAFPWVQLTLPGIAGILLSIGMAVDGNVIICERIKDEYRNGKSILSASHYGYRKSISAIVDGNVTTILASIILWIFGTGSVQGFAITLLIGIVLALFSSLVITPWLIRYFVRINQSNPKLYNLVRGEGFEELAADKSDSYAEMQMSQEKREKLAKNERGIASSGGMANNG
jgi:SecD/SecF fusion protein